MLWQVSRSKWRNRMSWSSWHAVVAASSSQWYSHRTDRTRRRLSPFTFLPLSLSPSLFLSLPLHLFVCLSHSLFTCLLYLRLSISFSIYLSLFAIRMIFFFLPVSLSLSFASRFITLSLSLCLNISLTNLPLDISYSLFQLFSINSLTHIVPRASQSYVHYFCLTHTGFWVSFFYTFTQALSHTKTFYSCAQRHVRLYLHRHYYYLSTCVCVSGWILQRVHAVLCVKTVRHIFWN